MNPTNTPARPTARAFVLVATGSALQRTPPQRTNEDTAARELVFYWMMWKETMAAGYGLQAAGSAEPATCSP